MVSLPVKLCFAKKCKEQTDDRNPNDPEKPNRLDGPEISRRRKIF